MFARQRSLLPIAALLLLAALPVPLLAGPPWLSLEYPVNPHNPLTKGALAQLRTYHHELSSVYGVRGILEGRVRGRAVTREVEVVSAGEPGLYAVRGEVPEEGAWVLRVTILNEQGGAMGTALAALAPDGSIGRVSVPFDVTQDGWTYPREVRADDIATMLAWSERMEAAASSETEASLPREQSRAGLWALLLLPLGLFAGRRVLASKS
jgi:hypothetical protein